MIIPLAPVLIILITLLSLSTSAFLYETYRYFKIDKSDKDETTPLYDYKPFRASFLILATILLAYISLEVSDNQSVVNISYNNIHNNHPFIENWVTFSITILGFIALIHRSITTDHQIKLQTNSNRISDYYNIKEHFYSQMKLISKNNHVVSINESNIEMVFSNIFKNPVELDFSCTKEFEDAILTFFFNYPKKSSFEKLEQLNFSRGNTYRSIYAEAHGKSESYPELFEVILQLQDYFNAISNLPISPKEKESFNVLKLTAKD